MRGDTASLPPLVIRGVDDVEDVPVPEAEPLAGEAAVLCPLVVEQRPVRWQISGQVRMSIELMFYCDLLHVRSGLKKETSSTALPGQRELVTAGPLGLLK